MPPIANNTNQTTFGSIRTQLNTVTRAVETAASNSYLTSTYVSNTAFQSFVANTNAYIASSGGGSSGIYSNTYVVSGTTTNATETEIFIDGIANSRIPISSNTSMMYIVETLAKRTDVLGDMASIELKSSAINNNGTVSDVGDVYEIVIARTDANILVDCRADNTNKSIGIYVTGVAGKTINWRAVVTTIEL